MIPVNTPAAVEAVVPIDTAAAVALLLSKTPEPVSGPSTISGWVGPPV